MSETIAATPPGPNTKHPATDELSAIDGEIATLASQLDAATHRFLTLIGEFDAREGWAAGGFRSCAHYLGWRVGLALGAAREHVRVARALPNLPQISEALRRGQLSYSKARAMTRVATPENEGDLLIMALAATASQVEKIVRGLRRTRDAVAANDEAEQQHARRHLDLRTEEDGSLRIEGRLPPELGPELKKALELAMEALDEEASAPQRARPTDVPAEILSNEEPRSTVGQRRADALVHLARSAMHQQMKIGPGSERRQIVLREPESGSKGTGPLDDIALADGTRLAPETARRLCCDISVATPGAAKRRLPTTRQRRALEARDGGCVFPGCTHERYLQPHHIEHWADGGATTLDNLVQLCSFHHRLVHEGGFALRRGEDGQLVFSAAGGRPIAASPPLAPALDCEEAIATLREQLRREGVFIDDETAPRWEGDALDLGWAVEILMARETPQESSRPESGG